MWTLFLFSDISISEQEIYIYKIEILYWRREIQTNAVTGGHKVDNARLKDGSSMLQAKATALYLTRIEF